MACGAFRLPTASHLSRTAEVIVVGAGVVGSAIGAELAVLGHDVMIVEQGMPGAAVSGASLACIGSHMVDMEELPLLAWACEAWRTLDEEVGGFEHNPCGQLRFILNEEDLATARAWIDVERNAGLDVTLLDPAEVLEVEPSLTGPIMAASWSKDDAVVNPFLAVRAFLNRARDCGARLETRCRVDSLIEREGKITGVRCATTDMSAEHVVLASGPWTARLAASLGMNLPVRPRKAQCLATVRIPPSIRRVVGACESDGGVEAGYTQIQQSRNGQVLFNTVLADGCVSDGAPDRIPEVDTAFVRDSVEMLLFLFPDLWSAHLLRSWVRFEAVTPDSRFLIGPLGPEGLWVAAGDCGTGFTRAPAIARLIGQMLGGEHPAFDTTLYEPDRFSCERPAST